MTDLGAADGSCTWLEINTAKHKNGHAMTPLSQRSRVALSPPRQASKERGLLITAGLSDTCLAFKMAARYKPGPTAGNIANIASNNREQNSTKKK